MNRLRWNIFNSLPVRLIIGILFLSILGSLLFGQTRLASAEGFEAEAAITVSVKGGGTVRIEPVGDAPEPENGRVILVKDNEKKAFLIHLTEPGSLSYRVCQEKGHEKSVSYDPSVYTVTVFTEASDEGLTPYYIYEKDGSKFDEICFQNLKAGGEEKHSSAWPGRIGGVQTGDSVWSVLCILVMAGAIILLGILLMGRKKKKWMKIGGLALVAVFLWQTLMTPGLAAEAETDVSPGETEQVRMLVITENAGSLDAVADILGQDKNAYLIQCDPEDVSAVEEISSYAQEDIQFGMADTDLDIVRGVSGEEAPESVGLSDLNPAELDDEENPFAELDRERDRGPLGADIALIDTGTNDPDVPAFSVFGDSTADENGHGTRMLSYIRAENPDASVISIRAMDSNGVGTASSVYAAIRLAMEQDVDLINLSAYARAAGDNACIQALIREANEKGIRVVGSAGNDGTAASCYLPGGIDEAIVTGSCDESGEVCSFSNYGSTVDYYVVSDSTSEAAAKMTGILSTGIEMDELLSDDRVYPGMAQTSDESTIEELREEEQAEAERFAAAATVSVWYGGQISNGVSSVGYYGINGKFAFCTEHGKLSLPTGTLLTGEMTQNEAVRKILYYGYSGPGECVSHNNEGFVRTTLALSNVLGDRTGGAGSSKTQSFVDSILAKASPPAGFTATLWYPANRSYQRLATWADIVPEIAYESYSTTAKYQKPVSVEIKKTGEDGELLGNAVFNVYLDGTLVKADLTTKSSGSGKGTAFYNHTIRFEKSYTSSKYAYAKNYASLTTAQKQSYVDQATAKARAKEEVTKKMEAAKKTFLKKQHQFRVVEIEAPEGYYISAKNPQSLKTTVTVNKKKETLSFTFSDQKRKGTIKIIKHDRTSDSYTKTLKEGTTLSGAEYTVYRDAACTDPVTKLTIRYNSSTKRYQAQKSGLELGTYYVKETKAPKGMELNPEKKKITLSFQNTAKVKVDKNGKITTNNKDLKQVNYSDDNGPQTVAGGNNSRGVAATYISEEDESEEPPQGPPEEPEPKVGYLKVSKEKTLGINKDTNEKLTGPEEGAVYQILSDDEIIQGRDISDPENVRIIGKDLVTDKNGTFTSDALEYGTYVLHQIAGAKGHELAEDQTFEISDETLDADGFYQMPGSGRPEIHQINEEKEIRLILTKRELGRDTHLLDGAVFGIYEIGTNAQVEEGQKPLSVLTTGEVPVAGEESSEPSDKVVWKGKASCELPYGRYLLREIKAADGYQKCDDITVILDENNVLYDAEDAPYFEVEAKDEPVFGKIRLKKNGDVLKGLVRSANGAVSQFVFEGQQGSLGGIANASYQLYARDDICSPDGEVTYYHAGDLIGESVTNVKGDIVFKRTGDDGKRTDKMYPGNYYIKESAAPDGYTTDPVEHDVSVSLTVSDEEYAGMVQRIPLEDYAVSDENRFAYAVLDQNGVLTFFRSGTDYLKYEDPEEEMTIDCSNRTSSETGVEYEDCFGNRYDGRLFTGIETIAADTASDLPWNEYRGDVTAARVATGQVIHPASTAYWFAGMSGLKTCDMAGMNTAGVTDMNHMFYDCSGLTWLVHQFNTSDVTNMNRMFAGLSGLTWLDLSGFSTENVTDAEEMFGQDPALERIFISSGWSLPVTSSMIRIN